MNMNSVLAVSKLSTRCQTTIPRAVRELLGAKAGDRIIYVREDERVYIRVEKKEADGQ